ncbi:MAG TPA: SprT-like domain-containing protein [Candidatus Akkermansia intestinigallinarum]|uniref:SprT-like domain-containing protein n=1 Tax=Candidatus Akkermansia intestinigallinarum TaxID=2838431 RepID=A0A9D1VBS3_9BACT|nr:SprT-like domain-containing protein [Candidatus Akkermansia intestinigallinarum]
MGFSRHRRRRGRALPPELLLPPLSAPPVEANWRSLDELEACAHASLAALPLPGWGFAWDRAVKRLGCCNPVKRRVSLSRYFAEHFLERDRELIRRTLLHELAHALCWQYLGCGGHGAEWRSCCAVLGIPDERSTVRCESFVPERLKRRPRYALCLEGSSEILRYYRRRPRRLTPAYLSHCYLPGRRTESLGRLRLVELAEDADLPPAPGLDD